MYATAAATTWMTNHIMYAAAAAAAWITNHIMYVAAAAAAWMTNHRSAAAAAVAVAVAAACIGGCSSSVNDESQVRSSSGRSRSELRCRQ